jgi:DNA topoisomerase-1
VPLSAITQDAVDEAKDHPREFDYGMVSAEITRDIIDKWVAQRMYSVIQNHTSIKKKEKIGVGRVKAAVLDLLTKRQALAESEVAESIGVNLTVNGRAIKGYIKNMPKENVAKFKASLQEKGQSTIDDKSARYEFNKLEQKTVPYMPPNRSTAGVLRFAYLNHGLKPETTMKLLQRLYIGGES